MVSLSRAYLQGFKAGFADSIKTNTFANLVTRLEKVIAQWSASPAQLKEVSAIGYGLKKLVALFEKSNLPAPDIYHEIQQLLIVGRDYNSYPTDTAAQETLREVLENIQKIHKHYWLSMSSQSLRNRPLASDLSSLHLAANEMVDKYGIDKAIDMLRKQAQEGAYNVARGRVIESAIPLVLDDVVRYRAALNYLVGLKRKRSGVEKETFDSEAEKVADTLNPEEQKLLVLLAAHTNMSDNEINMESIFKFRYSRKPLPKVLMDSLIRKKLIVRRAAKDYLTTALGIKVAEVLRYKYKVMP